jgi:hypothetical protein
MALEGDIDVERTPLDVVIRAEAGASRCDLCQSSPIHGPHTWHCPRHARFADVGVLEGVRRVIAEAGALGRENNRLKEERDGA